MATTPEGSAALRREAEALRELGPALPPPLRAPAVLAEDEGVLLLDAVPWRPRARPWRLPPEVAGALGAFWRATGYVHGDVAPWNLLRTPTGWVLCDWEAAGPSEVPGWDLWHWVCQAHALLGRPGRRAILRGLARGWLAQAVSAYARGAALSPEAVAGGLAVYLEGTLGLPDPASRDGQRGLAARRALLAELRGGRTR